MKEKNRGRRRKLDTMHDVEVQIGSGVGRDDVDLINEKEKKLTDNEEHRHHHQYQQQQQQQCHHRHQQQHHRHKVGEQFNFLELRAENSQRFRNFSILGRECSTCRNMSTDCRGCGRNRLPLSLTDDRLGQHSVAFYIDEHDTRTYFDSYGLPPLDSRFLLRLR